MNCPRCGAPLDEGRDCARCLMKLVLEGEAEQAPAKLRDLEILEPLGRGGMGQVYKARHPGLGRVVAVKILPASVSTAPDFNARFGREAQILAALDHPNIVRVFDYGSDGDQSFLVMEYVEGVDLRTRMAAGLSREQSLAIARQVCDALGYAHAQGIVHRDIKPENILVDRDQRVKLVDFGLARATSAADLRLTKPQQVMGTVHYMAPEQYEGLGEADHRADIYSLGVVLYELLSGELPVGRFQPPTRGAAPGLDRAVHRALEKEPGRRFQSVRDLRAALDGRPTRRRAIVAAAIAVALVSVASYLAKPPAPPPDPRDELIGSWKGTWTSEKDAKNRGVLESTIEKADSPGVVRLSFTLRTREALSGIGDFEVVLDGKQKVLTARRFTAKGQPIEGRWRFTILRVGDRLEGTYTITMPGMSDAGIFDQQSVK